MSRSRIYSCVILWVGTGLLSQCTNHNSSTERPPVISSGINPRQQEISISNSVESMVLESPYSMQQLNESTLIAPAVSYNQESGYFDIRDPDSPNEPGYDPDRADWDFLEVCVDSNEKEDSCQISHFRSWTLESVFLPLQKGDYQVRTRACVGAYRVKGQTSSCGLFSKPVRVRIPEDPTETQIQRFNDEMNIFMLVEQFFEKLSLVTTEIWNAEAQKPLAAGADQNTESFVRSMTDLISIGPYKFMNMLMEKDPFIMELTNRFRNYDYIFRETEKMDESSCHFFGKIGLTEGLVIAAGTGALIGVTAAFLGYMKHRYKHKKTNIRVSELSPDSLRKLNLRQDLYMRLDKALDHGGWQRKVNTLSFQDVDGKIKNVTFSRGMSPAERLNTVNQVITSHNNKYHDDFKLKSNQEGSTRSLRQSLATFESADQVIDLKSLKKFTAGDLIGKGAKAIAIGSLAGLAVGMTVAFIGNQVNLTGDQTPALIQKLQKECFQFLQKINHLTHAYDLKYL